MLHHTISYRTSFLITAVSMSSHRLPEERTSTYHLVVLSHRILVSCSSLKIALEADQDVQDLPDMADA